MNETALQLMQRVNTFVCGFRSVETHSAIASNSEIKRWFKNKAVIVNGVAVAADHVVEELNSLVLFPSGRRKTTIW